jgi:hypothetical protein
MKNKKLREYMTRLVADQERMILTGQMNELEYRAATMALRLYKRTQAEIEMLAGEEEEDD